MLTLSLSRVVLPLLGEYCDAGYREPKDRFIYALRSNGRYQVMVLGLGTLGAVYFFLQSGFRFTSFKGLVMALAYAWGLILAIYLMGHGLVAIPRRLYRNASISNRLRMLQSHAPKVHERLMDAIDKLDGYEHQVTQLQQRKNGTAREFSEWIDDLTESSSLPESAAQGPGVVRASNATIPAVITERYLAELTRKLKRARHSKFRFMDEWDRLVRSAVDTQAILDSAASKRLEFPSSSSSSTSHSIFSKLKFLTPYTRYHFYTYVIPAVYYLLSFVFALASASLIWSECIKSLDPKLSVVGLTVVHHPGSSRGQIGFAGQLLSSFWLLYMVSAALYSLTEVKIWGNRALVRRGTYPESATWYAAQTAKLTVPLAYNFITFVPPNIYRNSVFYKFLGKLINLTPLGRGFSGFFPVLVLVPVAATLFNLYGKVKNICGFGDVLEDEEDENAYGTGSWREGRALIEREIQGAGGNALGLAHRNGGISRSVSPFRDEPAATSAGASRVGAERPRGRVERRHLLADDDGELGADVPDAGFFGEFAERVKNTFDTADWKVPKWMKGSSSNDDRGPRSTGGSQARNSGIARYFGGRPAEGRVRL